MFNSKNNIMNILKTSTLRQSGMTFTFTLINGLLGMAFYILLARYLGPSDFGLFSLSIVVLALTADIGNLGINTGIVNFVSKYFTSDHQKSLKYLKLGFILKVTISLITLTVGFVLSPTISRNIFEKPELITAIRLVFLGVGTTWLFSFTTSYYQASQKFISWGLIQIFTNSLRLLGVIFAVSWFVLDLNISVVLYIIAPFIGFLVSTINIPFDFIKERVDGETKRDFVNYNKWVAVFGGVSAFSSRVDTFVLGKLVTTYSLGLYSAANQLVQVVPQLIGAIGTVVAPKFSSFDSDKKMLVYFKKLQLMVIGIAGVMMLSTPVVKLIINAFFGSEYGQSYPIFVILIIAMLVFMLSIPVHNAIIYYYQYPKLFSYLSVVNLAVVVTLAWVLTENFGVMGTGYSIIAGNMINLIVPMVWFIKKLNNKQKTINIGKINKKQ